MVSYKFLHEQEEEESSNGEVENAQWMMEE
jgi:hypothetical protein